MSWHYPPFVQSFWELALGGVINAMQLLQACLPVQYAFEVSCACDMVQMRVISIYMMSHSITHISSPALDIMLAVTFIQTMFARCCRLTRTGKPM